MSDARELFKALELAHYAERFRESIFVIALPARVGFRELLLDLKVLAGYHIQVVLVTEDPDFGLQDHILLANKRGARFHLSLLTEVMGAAEARPGLDYGRITKVLANGKMPVIAFHGDSANDAPPGDGAGPVEKLAAEVAKILGARKLILLTHLTDSIKQQLKRTHLLASEFTAIKGNPEWAQGTEQYALMSFVLRQVEAGIPDVILLEGREGTLFREVFTHDGAGLLVNETHRSSIRPAELRDITDIALLLRPEVEAGRIRPFTENEIEQNLGNYHVYEIDEVMVGLASLRFYPGQEKCAELSRFSTLPRYRGKGRARELALHLIEQARKRGLESVFALSVDARMWEFFLGLDFAEVPRDSLPEQWREGYDLDRPSKAFLRKL